MDRRRYLGTIASVAAIGIAGCQAPGDDGDGEETPTEGGATPTDAPTETPTETATGTPTEDGGGDETPTETDGGDGGGDDLTVEMVTEGDAYYFDPIGLYVESGQTVTFVNASDVHSSTAYHESIDAAEGVTRIPEGAEPWDSGTLTEEGATFEHTFETPGTYDYFCIPHKALEMVGRIVVDEPGGPAEGDMPPDGDVPESQTIVDQGSVSYEEFSG